MWCGRAFSALVAATTDHLVPRVKGGPSWPENEVAACRRCNAARGHLGVADWLESCRAQGWSSDTEILVSSLIALQEAISHRGGVRRARPHLESQLRRLRPVVPAATGTLRP